MEWPIRLAQIYFIPNYKKIDYKREPHQSGYYSAIF